MKTKLRVTMVLGLLLSTGSAAAESAAHQLAADGMAARDKGDHEEALRLFQQSHELEPSPMTLGLLGGEELSLHHWDEAEAHFAAALNHKDSEWVGRYRTALEGGLTEVVGHVGNLIIVGSPNGATVYVAGRVRGALPLKVPIRVSEGDVVIQITAGGYQPYVGHAEITGRRDTQLQVDLEKQKLVEIPVPAEEARPLAVDAGGSNLRIAAWIAAGGSVAALGVGVALQLVRANRSSEFNSSCRLDSTNQNRPTRFPAGGSGPDPCQGLYDDWNSSKSWPTIGYAVAGVFAVTSVALFVVSQSQESGTKHARVECGVGVGFASCGGVF